MSKTILHAEVGRLEDLLKNIQQRTWVLNKEFVDKIDALRTYAKMYPEIEDKDILNEIDELDSEFRQRFNQKLNTMDGNINIAVMFEIYSTILLIVETLNHKADELRLHMILQKFDFIERIPGAMLDDAKLITPKNDD